MKILSNTDTLLVETLLGVNNVFLQYADKNIFKESGITPTQFNILGEIIANNGLLVNELKSKLIISSPAISQLLGRMEKAGLIKRAIGKKDKREISITATPKAKKLYESINNIYATTAQKLFAHLPEAKKQQAIEFLSSLRKVIEK